MTHRKDVKFFEPEASTPESEAEDPDSGRRPAGRVIHDERGNAIWKWAGELASTGTGSGVLKHIDPNDLKMEGSVSGSAGPHASRARGPDPRAGYDPYNKSGPGNNTGGPKPGHDTRGPNNSSRGKR